MGNSLTLVLIIAIGYWILLIIRRKRSELNTKEEQQRELFLSQTKAILKTEATVKDNISYPQSLQNSGSFQNQIAESFKTQGYIITESSKTDGIDLIGIKENELALIRCEISLKEVKEINLKEFIADCTLYTDTHPILNGREIRRYYATNRIIEQEGHAFLRNHPSSLRLIEV